MASRLFVLIAAIAVCHASPIWFVDNGFAPGTLFIRQGRAPDFLEPKIAYGFGSGFSSEIGGIKHSYGIGSSFQSGGAKAYGAGIGSSDGNPYASGVGYANTNPRPVYQTSYPYNYSPYNGLRQDYTNNLGTAVSSAQSVGNGASIAQTHSGPYGPTAISSAQNRGYGSSIAISHSDSYGNAIASATDDSNSVLAATHTGPRGVTTSTAQAVQQQRGPGIQTSGATAYNVPGSQFTHSYTNTY